MNLIFRNFEQNKNFTPLTQQELLSCQHILQTAQNHQVTKVINIGTDLAESKLCIEIARHFQDCFATIGIHPNDSLSNWQELIKKFYELLQDKKNLKIVGIGECGIDKHYPNYNLKQQYDVFHAQIQLALQHKLALVIHSRNADPETYDIISSYKNEPNLKGTIHCFSSDQHYAEKYIDLGFILGIGGAITYPKNNSLRSIVQTIPLEKIILETDAPFLSPQSVRSQPNVPANIQLIAQFITTLRQESFDHITTTTSSTAKNLFDLM